MAHSGELEVNQCPYTLCPFNVLALDCMLLYIIF